MTTRASFLDAPYSAYDHHDIPTEDAELTHVGPGTPCGEYLRRFWQPVTYSDELKDLPLRLRIMGEDLVAFRDGSGQCGLLELHCPHRGTSLEFGQISHQGIRCCYHGWLLDANGRILETPGEPADSTLKARLFQGAYPTHEYGGIVFAYMGPLGNKPAFPIYDSYLLAGYQIKNVEKHLYPCNWLQVKENSMDPVHLSYLHTIQGNIGFTENFQEEAELEWVETPDGMVYTSTRRAGDNVWVRISQFILPNIHYFTSAVSESGSHEGYLPSDTTRWTVPIDDRNCAIFTFRHVPKDDGPPMVKVSFGQTDERPYEERQRAPGDYDAQSSIHWGIARHGMEHLATSDRGVIMLRRIVKDGIRAVQRGDDPSGLPSTNGRVQPTYASETVLRLPPAPTPEEDRQVLRDKAKNILESYVNDPPGLRALAG